MHPDASLLPMLTADAVVSGSEIVPKRTYKNVPTSQDAPQEVYLSGQAVASSGGYLPDDPLAMFRVPYQKMSLQRMITALSESRGFFNPKIDISRCLTFSGKTPRIAGQCPLQNRGDSYEAYRCGLGQGYNKRPILFFDVASICLYP